MSLKAHNIQLNVNNLFDKYYASEASKDTGSRVSYKAAKSSNDNAYI